MNKILALYGYSDKIVIDKRGCKMNFTKVKDFFKKYSKFFVWSGIVIILVLLIAVGYWLYLQSPSSPIATVNGKKITRSSFDKEKENLVKVANVSGNSYYGSDEFVRKELIERELVELIAKENGITVTQDEVNASIAQKAEKLGNGQDGLRSLYDSAYGLDNAEFDYLIRYDLLKTKVSDKLISEKSGRYIYTRFSTANGVEEKVGIKTEELESWAEKKINDYKTQLDGGKDFGQLYQDIQKENKYPAYYGEPFSLDENSELTDAEKNEIIGTSVGKHTKVIKVDKYFVIYYVEKGEGNYQSWDALIKEYSDKYVKYNILSQKNISVLYAVRNKVAQALKIPVAEASCAGCSGCDGARVYGYVWDQVYTSIKLGGGTVSGISASSDFCNGSTSSSVRAWCGYRTGSDATDSNGYYNIPRQDGSSCRFNCAGGSVTLTTNFANYIDESYTTTVTNGSSKRVDFSLYPSTRTLNVLRSPAAGGYVVGTGINCGNGATTCTYTYYFSSPDTTITAYALPGYRFVGWDDADPDSAVNYTTNTLTIDHTYNHTLTAIFVATHNITPSTDPGCNISPSTVQVVDNGGTSVPFNGSANTGYSFAGLSVDGSGTYQASPFSFTNVVANHTIRARCTQLHYGVIYNPNGATSGTVPTDGNSYTYNQPVTVFGNTGNLVRTGYTFDGWSTSASGNMDRPVNSTFNITGNTTLYAHWVDNASLATPTVSPNLEAISPLGSESNPYLVYGDSTSLISQFTLPGYDASSGGDVTILTSYVDNNGASTATVDTKTYGISSSIRNSASATGLGVGHTYRWLARAILSGAPTANSGNPVDTNPIYTTLQYFKRVSPAACSITPTSSDRPPLTSSISVSEITAGATYTIQVDGKTFTVLAAELPYYYTFSSAGNYSVTVDMTTVPSGTVKPEGLPCSANITVDAASGQGSGGEIAPN